jgi:hypothetical protein
MRQQTYKHMEIQDALKLVSDEKENCSAWSRT